MRKTPLALLASTALLAPTALIVAPAEAAPAQTSSSTVTNCSKTKYGVQVRIRIRDDGQTGRARVSHPRGTSKFEEDRVKRVAAGVKYTSDTPGGGATLDAKGNRPSFSLNTGRSGKTQVVTSFKLRNGKTINLSCTMR